MYNPLSFREERIEVLHAAMRDIAAASIVGMGPEGLQATHVPIELAPDPPPWGTLRCHFARANPHWQSLAEGAEVLAIFQGPQAYVSPNWYPSKHATGKAVPTWNYIAIHAPGTARIHEAPDWLRAHVTALTARHEARNALPWKLEDAPEEFIDGMLRAIVGVEIHLTRIEGKWKLSQNRPPEDRAGVVAGLRAQGDPAALDMAERVQAALDGGE